ncbi:MAG: cytochrome c oxidase subunit II [Verrucomicrobiota bacterium]
MKIPFFPDSASSGAGQVDHLYFFLIGMSVFFIVVIFVPMIFFLLKYRRGKKANRAHLNLPTNKIETTWTVIPTVIAIGIFGWAAKAYFDQEVSPANTLEINVVGKQWMWKVQHAEGNREINELHIPVNRPVKLTLASEDVIHDFFVPAFRTKQDVVPGRFTTEWFQPTKTGAYHLFCSEYCGMDHAKMIGTVFVMEPADYETWLAQTGDGNTLAQAGEKRYRQFGCSGCHNGPTTVRSPPLEGLYGKMVSLQDGKTIRADEKYFRDSILLPNSQITAGYEALMPTYQGRVSEEDLFQLIAYLKSIEKIAPPKIP